MTQRETRLHGRWPPPGVGWGAPPGVGWGAPPGVGWGHLLGWDGGDVFYGLQHPPTHALQIAVLCWDTCLFVVVVVVVVV